MAERFNAPVLKPKIRLGKILSPRTTANRAERKRRLPNQKLATSWQRICIIGVLPILMATRVVMFFEWKRLYVIRRIAAKNTAW
jgi:hypothetical protein